MLNSLYSQFDDAINEFDVYKASINQDLRDIYFDIFSGGRSLIILIIPKKMITFKETEDIGLSIS